MFVSRWWKKLVKRGKAVEGRERLRGSGAGRRFAPAVEALEPRWLPSTFTVTNTGDSSAIGSGSLRAAILSANASPGSVINFNVGAGSVVQTITPATALPAITAPVTIDGTTEPGYASTPLINLSGGGLGANGLQVTAANVTVRGLAVGGFGQAGILIGGGATGDLIINDFVGTNPAGTAANGNGVGVEISGAANNTLSSDVISGNAGDGVLLTGAGTTGNAVVGCLIGTNAAGTAALGNGANGVDVANGASGNAVGAAGSQPVTAGLALWLNADQGVTSNAAGQVTGWADQSGNNHSGTTQGSGLTLVPGGINGHNAVQFAGSGDLLLSGQVLTSQQYTVLAVVTDTHTNTTFHEVLSNWSGSNTTTSVFLGTTSNTPDRARLTDSMGGASDPNHTQAGVGTVAAPAQPFILTGLSSSGDASVYDNQFLIADKGSAIPTRNLSAAYYVGEQGTLGGEFWQGNIAELLVYNAALTPAQLAADWGYLQAKYLPDVISGNAGSGVALHDGGTTGNVVEGDRIGTDAGGTYPVANAHGVTVTNGAAANTVGGAAAAARNVISGNNGAGVWAFGAGANNAVQGNYVGTTAAGGAATAYKFTTVNGSEAGQVAANVPPLGGATAATVSFWMDWDGSTNGGIGEMPFGFTKYDLWLQNGYFGFNTNNSDIYGVSDPANLANQWHFITAVFVNGALTQDQLWIDGVQQTLAQKQGTAGTGAVTTQAYLSGWGTTATFRFGGALAQAAVFGRQLTAAQIQAEYQAADAAAYGETVRAQGAAAYYPLAEVGGTVAADASGNANGGAITSGGVTPGGAAAPLAVGNGYWGVAVADSPGTTVGGAAAGGGNVISGNSEGGVAVYGSAAVGTLVAGNTIGLTAAGTAALANGYSGIYVGSGSGFGFTSGTGSGTAGNTTIGGTTAAGANTISANGNYGIWLTNGTAGAVLQQNNVGTDPTGTVRRDNARAAVQIDSGSAQISAGTLVVDGTIAGGGSLTIAPTGTLAAADSAGASLSITVAGWVNDGTISANGATVNLGGSFTTAGLGSLVASGATVNVTGTLDNTGAVLGLNPAKGSWHVVGGTIRGGTVNTSGGSQLTLTGVPGPVGSGGTLDGVTLNGDLDLSATNANATVLDGITLNGTATVGAYADLYFLGSQTFSGVATVLFLNDYANALIAGSDNMTLTLGPNVTIHGGGNQTFSAQLGHSGFWGGGRNVSVVMEGTVSADTAGLSVGLEPGGTGALSVTGTLTAQGGTLAVGAPLALSGQAILSETSSGTIQLAGSLLATTTNVAQLNPQGTVILSGAGTTSAPQLLEAASQDLGAVAAGFTNNSAFGTLALGNNSYVRLVDQSHNSSGSGPDAVYANALVVPLGCTLDLNGLNLYVRDAQIAGTVTGGSVTQIPSSGPLALNSPTPGHLSAAGELDGWTFFARGGHALTVSLDPGSGAAGGPVSPPVQWARVQLLDPSGNVLASASNASAGTLLTLSNVTLPADGTYTVAVSAAPGHTSSTGNYVVAAYDVTPSVQPLSVNQAVNGTLATPYSVSQWTFSAVAGTRVQFQPLAASAAGLVFDLTGPNGTTVFTGLAGPSAVITLPASGTYILSARGTGGATGTFTFQMAETAPTALALATPYAGAFVGSGQSLLFTVNVPSAEVLTLQLSDAAAKDHVELYARFNGVPTRQVYDYGANGAGASQSLLIPSAPAGTWEVLVYGASVAAAPSTFSLLANAAPVVLTSVTPVHYGANAVAALTLNGGGFTTATAVALVAADNVTTYPAASVAFNTFAQLTATVNLAGVPAGVYSVRVANADGSSSTLPAAFTVTAAGQAHLQTQLILPGAVGRHVAATFYVQYSNTGTVAMPAPVLLLESTVADDLPRFTLNPALLVSGLWTTALGQGYSNTVEILASGKVPGVLEPGESVTVPVYYAGMQQPWNFSEAQFHFDLRVFTTSDGDTVNWSALQSSLQPAGVSATAWNAIYNNLVTEMGGTPAVPAPLAYYGYLVGLGLPSGRTGTWGGYVQLLDNEAAYLGQLGEDVTDIGQLWGFAVQQADNALSPVGPALTSATDDAVAVPGSLSLGFSRVFSSTVGGRETLGPLGYGWSTSWQTSAAAGGDGKVTITGGDGSQRVFQPDSRTAGAYFSQPGDTGTLRADGRGGYLLTEADGSATDFNPNGTLNYLQDTNGNRITAGYAGGRLVSLTASSGPSLTIGYNTAGLITSVSDSEGRTTTYSYDLTNDELRSVTGYNGQTTSYTYEEDPGFLAEVVILGPPAPQLQHALTAVAFPGGTHEYFTYNAYGWLTGTSSDGGAQPQGYAYTLGQVSVTDGTGDTSRAYYNEQGLVVKSLDALGNATVNTYDGNFNLTKVTNALGQSETYTHNTAGEVTSSTDFLGNTTHFSYAGPFHALASMTDANGNTTNYAYSSAGDLLKTTYANGTSSSSTYDPEGDATSFLNANGQLIGTTYNAAGQKASETFADGTSYAYTYDARGDLLTATDATGTTTFSYDPTTELLTKVAYPNGTSLTFSYNAAGQRTSMVDQSGFTVNYGYDPVGRLSELTDGNGNLIVSYTYDADGRLSQKTNGNGTYTTYQYDADGNVLHLINYAPGGAINSRFDYTYNALGLETSEATVDGNWTYSYDADAQLIHAVFTSTNPNVASQDLAYSYDAMGNRITTVINGVTTAYTSNNVNEYTSVGGVSYTYDADGNLTFDGVNTYTYNSLNQLVGVSGPGGMTTYTYNALGQRVATTTIGQATEYLIDPSGMGNVVGQYAGAGALVADYTYGLGLTSQVTAGGSYYYDFDAIGSTRGLSNSVGSYVNSYRYLPFGESLTSGQAIGNPFQFVGRWGVTSDLSGLDSMRARYYQPATGRFTTNDPLGLAGGTANTRSYAGNDPIGAADPEGLFWFLIPELAEVAAAAAEAGEVATIEPAIAEGIAATGTALADAYAATSAAVADAYWNVVASATIAYQDALESYPVITGILTGAVSEWLKLPDEEAPSYDEANGQMAYQLYELYEAKEEAERQAEEQEQAESLQRSHLPQLPGGDAGGQGATGAPEEEDPNALLGPAGYGAPNFVAGTATPFPYEIQFENAPSATAPAQQVTITDQLDPNLDWTTFQLTSIAWGDTVIDIPAGSQFYQTTVPMTYNGETFDVQVEAGINPTGQVYATFQSIDPDTQLPPDVLTGFLPPEDGTGRGTGSVGFTVQPLAGLPTGTQVRNVALVTFGINAAIATDQANDEDPTQGIDPNKQALVTIDSGAPSSSVSPLPAFSATSNFTVSWSGADDPGGSGVAGFDVYVSDNGGPFTLWLAVTPATSATFTGTPGHTYAFFSVATDNVGNQEPLPTAAQATTTVQIATTTSLATSSPNATSAFGDAVTFTATVVSGVAGAPAPDGTVSFYDGTAFLGRGTLDGSGAATFVTSALSVGQHAVTAVYDDATDAGATLDANFLTSTGTLVQTVNPGGPVDVTNQVQVSRSGLTANRRAGTFAGSIGITNSSGAAIGGGLIFVWQGLSAGVSVRSASVTINGVTTQLTVSADGNGNPQVVVGSALLTQLAAGQTISLNVVYYDPTFSAVDFTPDLISDPSK